jgi:hypothetical protein
MDWLQEQMESKPIPEPCRAAREATMSLFDESSLTDGLARRAIGH